MMSDNRDPGDRRNDQSGDVERIEAETREKACDWLAAANFPP